MRIHIYASLCHVPHKKNQIDIQQNADRHSCIGYLFPLSKRPVKAETVGKKALHPAPSNALLTPCVDNPLEKRSTRVLYSHAVGCHSLQCIVTSTALQHASSAGSLSYKRVEPPRYTYRLETKFHGHGGYHLQTFMEHNAASSHHLLWSLLKL